MAERAGAGKHSLMDHLAGEGPPHDHAGEDYDHDHDGPGALDPRFDPAGRKDPLDLVSVGIDIGSSGTQVIFSRMRMQRMSGEPPGRFVVAGRETLYQSPVALTPYEGEGRIDERRVGEIIDAAYAAARIHPDGIDTGAVILTGEASRRGNARAIAEVIAELGGEFVCATAGHHMESHLAAHGSGAARISQELQAPLLNVDIGGGTTKLALVENGRVVHSAAIHIGGRLAVMGPPLLPGGEGDFAVTAAGEGRLARLDPAGRRLANNARVDWKPGGPATAAEFVRVAEWMADALMAALTQDKLSPEVAALWLTEPLAPMAGIAGVMFSGGVAEYVYGREDRDFGDLGRHLGHAVRRRVDSGMLPFALLPAGECIRATATGASEHTVQLSGDTAYISDPGALLPRKNLQVLQPDLSLAGDIDPVRVAQAIRRHFRAFDLVEGEGEVAIAVSWEGPPAPARVEALARGIVEAMPMTLLESRPLFLVVDGEIAQSLGALLKEGWQVSSEVLVIDGIALRDFDYVDLGRVRVPSRTVPVTIKSLVFDQDPRGPRPRGHRHLHGVGTHTHR